MAGPSKKAATPLPLIVEADPRSPAAEAYRTLRTNIQFAGLDTACRTIVVTSATPGEGKSTTVSNFGSITAQGGSRVCLIDSDLRRPALHRFFGFENTRGLTSALVEDVPFKTVAQQTNVPNLWVVPSGPLPPNPAEMAGSKRLRELLQGGLDDFDVMILDSPPAISVSDAIALSAQCDGVILVIRVGTVPPDLVRRVVEQIEAVHGRILGVLLNSASARRDGYYSNYYRYYHAYYGEGTAERKAGARKR